MRNVRGCGCSRATYRRAQVIHSQEGQSRGGGSRLLLLRSGFPHLPRCHTQRNKSTRCRQLSSSDGQTAQQEEWETAQSSPGVTLTAQPSTLPLSSEQSKVSRLTAQITRETRYKHRDTGDSSESTNCCTEMFYNQPAAPPPPVSDSGPPSLVWKQPISTLHITGPLPSSSSPFSCLWWWQNCHTAVRAMKPCDVWEHERLYKKAMSVIYFSLSNYS